MLKFTHEHWKQKAEDEYYAAVTEQEKAKGEDKHMFEWNRRYKEGKWLLKGVAKVEDAKMNTILEQKAARDKQNKYIPEEEVKKKKKAQEQGIGAVAVPVAKTNHFAAVASWFRPREQKVNKRVRNARFVIKEGIAKMLVHRDVQNERDAFIKNNAFHIRVLQNVRLNLQKPKLPAHHADLSLMTDADPPMSAEVAGNIALSLVMHTKITVCIACYSRNRRSQSAYLRNTGASTHHRKATQRGRSEGGRNGPAKALGARTVSPVPRPAQDICAAPCTCYARGIRCKR
jgi:hypothetical protein